MDTIVAAGSGMAEGAPERPQFAQQADLKPQAQPGVALEPVDSGMPLIVLMGMPSAGKTSILQVLFNKLSPHETLHKSMSTHVQFDEIHYSDFVHFEVCDVPGHVDVSSLDAASEIFSRCSALIFVIDAQNAPYMDALQKFVHTVAVAQQIKDDIRIEVFIHKVEELSDEQCGITLRDIQAEILDESFVLQTSFHLTSIYDPSIYEAFSKVVQKLNPNVGMLESLLDLLISHCRLEKAFLFDVASKICEQWIYFACSIASHLQVILLRLRAVQRGQTWRRILLRLIRRRSNYALKWSKLSWTSQESMDTKAPQRLMISA
eukprot:SAG31_NODE_871_length_11335_cov_4.910822_1_plen_319_part_00